jgi:hypothetical protein
MAKKTGKVSDRQGTQNPAQKDPDALASHLRLIRQERQWSMSVLAAAVVKAGGKVSDTLILRIIDGSRSVPYEVAAPLAIALGYGSGQSFENFIELVAMANLLRGLERYEMTERKRSIASAHTMALLRSRMATLAREINSGAKVVQAIPARSIRKVDPVVLRVPSNMRDSTRRSRA